MIDSINFSHSRDNVTGIFAAKSTDYPFLVGNGSSLWEAVDRLKILVGKNITLNHRR